MADGPLLGADTPRSGHAPALPDLRARLRVHVLSGERRGSSVLLGGSLIRIGRAPGNTVCLPDDRAVSAQHAKIVRFPDAFVLLDLDSTNGTFLNGERVERARLRDGDVIQLAPGGPALRLEILPTDGDDRDSQATVVIPNFAELAGRRVTGSIVRELALDRPAIDVGRGAEAHLRLDSPIVSKLHARFASRQGVLTVEDLRSANGTYLEGRRIERAQLTLGDRVVVGPFQIEVLLGRLRVLDTRNRARLDAQGLTVRSNGRAIIEDVSLALPPGTFTAIIGPSGAGKTTLLSALSGTRPADQGRVWLNGVDLYEGLAAMKSSLGIVPQDDIVHRELTVAESLAFAARLRLPPDTDAADRARRCASVLATLELTDRARVPVRRLSGGQRKRVSIGMELLTEPSLLFLDEPASGLDPGLEESLMLLLRELSYKGKTVVLVTHSLDHVSLCDQVILLADGRLIYAGRSSDLTDFFGIPGLPALYPRLKEQRVEEWRRAFQRSAAPAPSASSSAEGPSAVPADEPARLPPVERPHPVRQLIVLTQRQATITGRDLRNAALLMAQAPIIAGLIGLSLLYGSSELAFTKPRNTILFLLALTAVWFGCSNAAREIVKERAIYLRERMINLGLGPYLASKVVVQAAIAAVQCLVFFAILDLWFGIPGRPLLVLAAMLLASLVGILLGLALSALATSADRALTLLPILLIPQVLFTLPAVQMDMKGPAGVVAKAMPTWWAFDLMRRCALAPDEATPHDALEARLKAGQPLLLTRQRFEAMFRQGYPVFEYRDRIEITWTAAAPERLALRLPVWLGAWRPAVVDGLVLVLFGAALAQVAGLSLKRLDRRR